MPEDKELVTIADMAQLPVKDGEFDMVVYSLSLMGTNIDQILLEANRILRNEGILYIIEVQSRVKSVKEFIEQISKYGFKNITFGENNYIFEVSFQKTGAPLENKKERNHVFLEPCIYKRR